MKRMSKRKSGYLIGCVMLVALCVACGIGDSYSVPWVRSAVTNNVIFIGDSIFALSGEIQNNLQVLAGTTFRNYCISGANLASDNIATNIDVKEQYAIARSDNSNIKTIIMDGGGNDILIPATSFDPYNCKVDWWESGLSSTCKAFINDVYVEGVDLLNQLGRDGVQNVIFQGYYHLKNGLVGTTTLNPAVDYGDTMLAKAVKNATAGPRYRVYIDPRTTIVDSDIVSDGIHPNSSGSSKLANLIWPKLKTKL
jgi:lysophospholipase L1-like esterase